MFITTYDTISGNISGSVDIPSVDELIYTSSIDDLNPRRKPRFVPCENTWVENNTGPLLPKIEDPSEINYMLPNSHLSREPNLELMGTDSRFGKEDWVHGSKDDFLNQPVDMSWMDKCRTTPPCIPGLPAEPWMPPRHPYPFPPADPYPMPFPWPPVICDPIPKIPQVHFPILEPEPNPEPWRLIDVLTPKEPEIDFRAILEACKPIAVEPVVPYFDPDCFKPKDPDIDMTAFLKSLEPVEVKPIFPVYDPCFEPVINPKKRKVWGHVDEPHEPWGPHVDFTLSLTKFQHEPQVPVIEKLKFRIDPDGEIISESLSFRWRKDKFAIED